MSAHSSVHSHSLSDLVYEIVDVTPSPVLIPEPDRVAFQVNAALVRSREASVIAADRERGSP